MINFAATKYPLPKIISSIHAADKDMYRPELNKGLGTSRSLHPNVHFANNDNITVDDGYVMIKNT